MSVAESIEKLLGYFRLEPNGESTKWSTHLHFRIYHAEKHYLLYAMHSTHSLEKENSLLILLIKEFSVLLLLITRN